MWEGLYAPTCRGVNPLPQLNRPVSNPSRPARMNESLRLRAVQSPIIPVIADLVRAHPGTISLGQGVVGYAPPPEAFAELGHFAADPANHKYRRHRRSSNQCGF